ncbi:hypothetical protein GCM10023115_04160 [Pontixanthobacter gangjinensis]|uniref:Uncharacterized protein n=1 Tax=Pontixanthobacter gangjinensis TaxID=1028742 RepID=A0A6I4SIX9_9SPHN|nr:hypothetical protein [Pontixanthobacter gangjinensis]MXO55669.1 hypothetical protein [Pontixanthobacter gangjinensis]
MKSTLFAASLLLASGAHAQEVEMTPTAETAQPAEEAAVEAAAALTIDSPIADLMADERAKAVVDANVPGVELHPAYDQIKGMSFKEVQPFSGGAITDEMIAAIASGLAELS